MPDQIVIQQLRYHSQRIDYAVLRFLRELDRVLATAQASLHNRLLTLLTIEHGGQIAATVANQRILRRLPLLWREALDSAGLDQVIGEYMRTFPEQVPQFIQVLQAVNHQAKNPLPIPDFTKADQSYFGALQVSTAADLSSVIEGAGQSLLTRSIFAFGGIGVKQLAQVLMKKASASAAQAASLAETSVMAFYRAVSDVGFRKIEAATGKVMKYVYLGPDDAITRPFCHWMLAQHRSWTRPEVDKLDNGQTGPGTVFIYGGGFRCRHSLNLSTEKLLS